MNKEELLKLLREANITSADLAEIEQETKQSKNHNKYECDDCKIKFASNTKKRKCPSCKSSNLSLLESKTKTKKETKTEEKPYIHKTGLNIQNLGQSQASENSTDEEDKKFTRIEPVNLKKIKNIKKIDSGLKLKNDEDFDSKVKFNKTPRDRQQFKLVKIRCNGICGEVKEVNPAYLQGRSRKTWECDKCLLSKKSQR